MSNLETIHETLLNNISDDYQKTIGYPTYDLLKSVAFGLAELTSKNEAVTAKINVDNLIGDELTRFVKQRKGVYRKLATKAKAAITITGTGQINIGDLFETAGGVQFASIESKAIAGSGTVLAESVIPGVNGNVGANSIVKLPVTISGITAINNINPATGGYDEETDVALRERYYTALQTPATSGNKYHYRLWALEVTGVGDARVFPLWNGNNTVQVVIIDSLRKPANSELAAKVQLYIDPNSTGTGEGQAPIGAKCTVVSATAKTINVAVTVNANKSYNQSDIEANINADLDKYFSDISFKQDYISYFKTGGVINDVPGVYDYSNFTLNNGSQNISIGEKEVPVLGSVVVTFA